MKKARELPGPPLSGSYVNTAEAFFALLKRGIMGSFHSVSEQHLQRYADEFAFRWNHRLIDDTARTNEIIKATAGKRLTYRRVRRQNLSDILS